MKILSRQIAACAAALVATVVVSGSAAPAQIQAIPHPSLPRGLASITGVVMGEGRPVPGATVVLSAHDHWSPNVPEVMFSNQETISDAGGRFAFVNLPSLPLMVSASASGFATGIYGQSRPGFDGTPIQLAGSQKFEATILLARGRRISGAVQDARGVPAAGIEVYAFRLRPMGDTELLMSDGGHAVTDERGQFTISDLPVGRFQMMAYRKWGNWEPSPIQKGLEGEPAIESAADEIEAIELDPGESRTGVELRLRLKPTTTIAGRVRYADESPASGARVRLFPRDGQPFAVSEAVAGADGSFELGRVTPGPYRVVAYSQPGEQRWGDAVVESDGRKRSETVIDLRPGATVSGRVVYAGRSAIEMARPVTLFFARILSGMRDDVPGLARSAATPEFTYRGVPPGRYTIFVNRESLQPGWFVQSEMVDGLDALDFPFAVRGAETKQVLITLSDAWTEIAGRVTDRNNAASTEGTVVVFPVDESYWGVFSRRIETIRPDTNGQYRLRGLPAGEYVLALGNSEIYGRPHSSLLRKLRSAGRRFTLRPGDSLRIDVPGPRQF